MRVAVVAPANRVEPGQLDPVVSLARDYGVELVIDPQCYAAGGGHVFAGPDDVRAAALLRVANDPGFDAVWFARGGYGSNRLLDRVMPKLERAAHRKTWLGYSDIGFLLGALHARRIGQVVHGPMPADIGRDGGEAAVRRSLAWLAKRDRDALEPGIIGTGRPAAAFNLSILATLIGTRWLPDLAGHDLLIEEVSEHRYRIDRMMFGVGHATQLSGITGIRIGAMTQPPPVPSDPQPDFGETADEIASRWALALGTRFLGRARIGHDADNRVVPFGVVL